MDGQLISTRHVERSETSGLEIPSQILRKLRMTVVVLPSTLAQKIAALDAQC
jgi:hypothetical protein